LAENLARALRYFGVDAYAEDLDLASPTLEFIRGSKGWEQRQSVKKQWTPELAETAAVLFEKASDKYAVVIGDAPGKITSEATTIAKKAHYAIILCREDCKDEFNNWRRFFVDLNIPIICVAVSKMTGVGDVKESDGMIEAILIDLKRNIKADSIITTLALLVKETLGF